MHPLHVEGQTIHQIGIPFQWGYAGETVGSSVNDLIAMSADPNVSMHETKVFACQVRAGTRRQSADQPTVTIAPWANRDAIPDTPHRRSRKATCGKEKHDTTDYTMKPNGKQLERFCHLICDKRYSDARTIYGM